MTPPHRAWMLAASALFVAGCDKPVDEGAHREDARPPVPEHPLTDPAPSDASTDPPPSAATEPTRQPPDTDPPAIKPPLTNREPADPKSDETTEKKLQRLAQEQASMKADQSKIIDLGKIPPAPPPGAMPPPGPAAPPDPAELE